MVEHAQPTDINTTGKHYSRSPSNGLRIVTQRRPYRENGVWNNWAELRLKEIIGVPEEI